MVDVVREEICVAYPVNRKVKITLYIHDFCSVIPFFHPFPLVLVVVVVLVLEFKGH